MANDLLKKIDIKPRIEKSPILDVQRFFVAAGVSYPQESCQTWRGLRLPHSLLHSCWHLIILCIFAPKIFFTERGHCLYRDLTVPKTLWVGRPPTELFGPTFRYIWTALLTHPRAYRNSLCQSSLLLLFFKGNFLEIHASCYAVNPWNKQYPEVAKNRFYLNMI